MSLLRKTASGGLTIRALSKHRDNYASTIPNLRLTPQTRVVYQGFTGKVSTANAKESIAYGTNIVGGTTPGKSGEHLGLPLYPSLREATQALKPDATAVFVAAQHAAKAIEDAIENEIPLIVAIAEFLPVHDVLRISEILKTQSKSRLVGANAPGVISPLHHCRIGFQPIPCYMPGHIGIIAKSGTLSYETVGALTRAGLGQSLCIGMGGDIVAGTNMIEALEFFENDEDTDVILLAGEVGGNAEVDAASWIKDYRSRSRNPKPIAALVAGKQQVAGRIMGHAGAFRAIGEHTAADKAGALSEVGVTVVQHPTEFATVIPEMIKRAGGSVSRIKGTPPPGTVGAQKRGYHTMRRRPAVSSQTPQASPTTQQRRNLHFTNKQTATLLQEYGITVQENQSSGASIETLAFTIDRSARQPAIAVKAEEWEMFPYKLSIGPDDSTFSNVISNLKITSNNSPIKLDTASVSKLLTSLATLFKDKEAYEIETQVTADPSSGAIQVTSARISFDDSALKSGGRQQDVHAQRDLSLADKDEYSVEKDGIVYIKVDNPSAYVATLINGAGLAMNALDVLAEKGASPTNFLDTGGKATSETIKKSFEVILKDPRVKVIFVNIFGGLTRCDMVAEGIILAFKELGMDKPVVVRLRGTNEEAGQKMIAESGLPLHAFDDFFEAAEMCKKLGTEGQQ